MPHTLLRFSPHKALKSLFFYFLIVAAVRLSVLCVYCDNLVSVYLSHTDCGLSVRWDHAEDTGSCDEFSPASIKDRLTDPEKEVQHNLVSTVQNSISPRSRLHPNGIKQEPRRALHYIKVLALFLYHPYVLSPLVTFP